MLSPILQAYHNSHRSTELFQESGISRKAGHVQRVSKLFEDYPELFISSEMDAELAKICAEHHDDGRLLQYQKTRKLDDSKFSHQDAGAQMLDEFCITHGVRFSEFPEDILILRNVMLYHGSIDYVDNSQVLPVSLPYVKAVTAADELENSMSCVSYLKRNYYNDEKKLSFEHRISPDVWHWYSEGQKFNKLKYCTTYDEYILFSGMLAIYSIKKYGQIAKWLFKQPGFDYPSILIGFHDIFYELLLPEDAKMAYQIMYAYVYGK